jgi:2-methylcitrate dehydratase PrpD
LRATVAAGRVLGLDVAQMVNALGIVYSQAAGNHQVTRDGALTKRMQPGFAAQAALVSVQLARRGVRGAQATFEGADGFLRVYLRDRCDRDVLRKGLGEHFEFTQLSYKPYPCCRFNHTGIDAALALRASAGVSASACGIFVSA